jgi:plastocyanin
VTTSTVTLQVRNTGQALHNVSVAAQNIDMDVSPGQTVTVPIKVGAAPISFFCKYHRTSGMVGALVPAGS